MKSRSFNFRNILFVVIVVFQVTWYALILKQLASEPLMIKRVDYVAIYTAGYIAHYRGLPFTYDLDLQRQVEGEFTYPVQLARFYPYNHPPHLVRILQLITTRDYIASFYRWMIVLVVFHLVSVILLARLMRLFGWQLKEILAVVISGLLFYPIFATYLKGQDSAFLLFGVTVWTYGLLTAKDKITGLGLVLVAIRPQIALMLALPFLFKRRKVWWWFIAWGFIFFVYCYLLIGSKGIIDFIGTLLLSGAGIDVDKMPTLMGAIMRAFPNISTQVLYTIGYSGYALAILFLCLVWAKCQKIEFKHVGLAILFSMVFSPHLHVHDLSLLLIPAIGAAVVLVEQKMLSQENAAFLPLAVSLLFLVIEIFWFYSAIYLTILLLGLLLWLPGWQRARLKGQNG